MFSRSHEDRLKRLAQKLEQVAEKDRRRMEREEEMLALRQRAAEELHKLCADFVNSINALVTTVHLDLAPPVWETDTLKYNDINMIQINVSGRIVQLSFQITDTLEEKIDIRVPYTLHGAVRWFNQDLLERDEVRDDRLYYCIGRSDRGWRYVDSCSQKLGLVDQEYLTGIIEQLLQ